MNTIVDVFWDNKKKGLGGARNWKILESIIAISSLFDLIHSDKLKKDKQNFAYPLTPFKLSSYKRNKSKSSKKASKIYRRNLTFT